MTLHQRASAALLVLGCIRQSRERLTITEDAVRQLEAMAGRKR